MYTIFLHWEECKFLAIDVLARLQFLAKHGSRSCSAIICNSEIVLACSCIQPIATTPNCIEDHIDRCLTSVGFLHTLDHLLLFLLIAENFDHGALSHLIQLILIGTQH